MSAADPSGFDASLRFEVVSDEGRALLTSYLLATLLAVAWLALVHIVPRPLANIGTKVDDPVIVVVPPPELALPPLEVGGGSTEKRLRSKSSTGSSPEPSTIKDMFRGNTGLVDASTVLRNVDVTRSGAGGLESGSLKVGLNTGVGSRTPGRTRDDGLSGVGVGAVSGAAVVSRSPMRVGLPEVHAVGVAPSAAVASAVGQAAREHVPQLERCYRQEGLTRNPSLGGLVRLAVTVEAGRVTSADIVGRSWSGAGAADTESCLVRTAQQWRFGNASARIVLPLSFTSPERRSP